MFAAAPDAPDAAFALAELQTEIEEADHEFSIPTPIVLHGEEKASYEAE